MKITYDGHIYKGSIYIRIYSDDELIEGWI